MNNRFGLIELGLVFGGALALGIWEFFNIRREILRGREIERERQLRPPDTAHQ
ncbi:hypothetical protein [Hyphomicrobium sp. ghe19]|uniref:hypothetical protein n=1 Tax=Hyphomicrobium sp. ghe19 TaxID=2682968 RepID=UPI0030D2781A